MMLLRLQKVRKTALLAWNPARSGLQLLSTLRDPVGKKLRIAHRSPELRRIHGGGIASGKGEGRSDRFVSVGA